MVQFDEFLKRFFFQFFLFFIISFFTCRNWANTLCSVTYWYQLIVETRFYVVLAEGNIGTKNHLVPVVFNRTKKVEKFNFSYVEIRDNEHTFLHKRRSTSRAKVFGSKQLFVCFQGWHDFSDNVTMIETSIFLVVSSHTWVPTVLLIAWSWRLWPPPLGLWRLPLPPGPCTDPVGPPSLCCCWSTQPFVIDGLFRPVKTKKQKWTKKYFLCFHLSSP